MKPIVGIGSQSLEIRSYMANLVRELISEFGPVLIPSDDKETGKGIGVV